MRQISQRQRSGFIRQGLREGEESMNAAEFYKQSATSFIVVDPDMQEVIFKFAEDYAKAEKERADRLEKDVIKVMQQMEAAELRADRLQAELTETNQISRTQQDLKELYLSQAKAAEEQRDRAVRALHETIPWLRDHHHISPQCYRGSDDGCCCGLDDVRKLVAAVASQEGEHTK